MPDQNEASRITVCTGSDLPPLLHHHEEPTPPHTTHPWQPPLNSMVYNKPEGGLWASPVTGQRDDDEGHPIPVRSAWSDWCDRVMPEQVEGDYRTEVFAAPRAVFAVIDSAADAIALHEAFPAVNPVRRAMEELARDSGQPLSASDMAGDLYNAPYIDWAQLASSYLSGVYLTATGQRATHLPRQRAVVPSLNGWDMATVWFSHPEAIRLGPTRPAPITQEGQH